MPRRRPQAGQASVELVALLPLLCVLAVLGWQAVVAGQAVWLAGTAARSAARAHALGSDPRVAARDAVPGALRAGARVRTDGDGVEVRLAVPSVVARLNLGSVVGRARFPPQATR